MKNQRTTLIMTAVITAFILVVIGGVTASLMRVPTTTESAPITTATTNDQVQQTTQPTATISADRAALVALDAAVGSRLAGTPELVNYEGTVAYEVRLDRGNVYVDAQTGNVLTNSVDSARTPDAPASGESVTREQAIEIATRYVGGGTVAEVELENERGVQVYEVEFVNGGHVYVDAATGQVVYAQLQGDNRRAGEEEGEYSEREEHERGEHDE